MGSGSKDHLPLHPVDASPGNGRGMKRTVLLVSPPFLPFQKKGQEPCFPLGLGYIASSLEFADFRVGILDMDGGSLKAAESSKRGLSGAGSLSGWDALNWTLRNTSPDIVGISVMSPKLENALRVSACAREVLPDCTVIMGGNHPTALPEELLARGHADYVVRGEGEATMSELCQAIDKGLEQGDRVSIPGVSYSGDEGVINNPPRQMIEDLDTLPHPARHLLLNEYDQPSSWGGVIASRGCPYRCSFCASKTMWGRRVRYRSVENVMEEVDQVVSQYGSRYIRFFDDTFTMGRKRLQDLCSAMSDYRPVLTWEATTRVDQLDDETVSMMAGSGCIKVYIGIESGSPGIRERIHKDESIDAIKPVVDLLNRYAILSVGFYMTGIPSETLEDMNRTRLLMGKLKTSYIALAHYTLLPGSDDFESGNEDFNLNEAGNYFLPSEEYLSSIPPDMAEMTRRIRREAAAHERSLSTRVRRGMIKLRQRCRKIIQ